MKKLRYSVLIAGLLATSSAASGQAVPIGGEFGVNTYSTGKQTWPTVAVAPDGNFVVVWSSYGSSGTDGSSWSVQAQRFAADGSKLGAELQANTSTTGPQFFSSVAVDAGGNFVVVWTDRTDADRVRGQRFDTDGAMLGDELQVSTGAEPAVAIDADGNFVVVWTSAGKLIKGQRFAADGSLLGAEIQVSPPGESVYAVGGPEVAVAADSGEFVVAWSKVVSFYPDVVLQRFGADGSPLGGDVVVSDSFFQDVGPSVSASPAGEFVVVWKWGPTAPYQYALGDTFHSDGAPAGDLTINSHSLWGVPKVAMAPPGQFVVVWSGGAYVNDYPDGSGTAILGQVFSFDASRLGGEFIINTQTTGYQESPNVAIDTSGRFVVVWTHPLDGRGYDLEVRGRRFLLTNLFKDDFESGDVSAWSEEHQ